MTDNELMKKLKNYTAIVECITEDRKYQPIEIVATSYEECLLIMKKWNEKCVSEKRPKLNYLAILEGKYRYQFSNFMDQRLIVPSKYSTYKGKQSKEEMFSYYQRLKEILEI